MQQNQYKKENLVKLFAIKKLKKKKIVIKFELYKLIIVVNKCLTFFNKFKFGKSLQPKISLHLELNGRFLNKPTLYNQTRVQLISQEQILLFLCSFTQYIHYTYYITQQYLQSSIFLLSSIKFMILFSTPTTNFRFIFCL